MRTLISLNGWWGFFFRRNSRILAFTAILLVVFVTDLGGTSDWPNGKLVGIVSIGDVVKRLLEKYEQEAELIKQFINS
jgi:CBS domain-containing protein